jgi:CP family cyanate transporter-like MFS transporter
MTSTRRDSGLGVAVAVVLLALNLRTVVASLPPLLDTARADLGLSATAAGLLTALPLVCFGALAPVAPRLARRFGLEGLLAICAAATAAGAALRAVGGTGGLFAGSIVAGVAVAVAQAALPVFIRTAHPERTGPLTGAFSMALPLGATIAAASAVPLEHLLGGSWRASLASWALPGVAAAVLWALRPGPGTLMTGAPPPPLLGTRLAWEVSLFFGVQSMAFYVGLAWLPEILADSGYSAGTAGALQALSSVVQILPAFVVPVLAARVAGQAGLLVLTVAVGAAAAAGLLLAPGLAPLWMVALGLNQGGTLGLGLILPVLRAAEPAAVASLTAMMLCVGYLVAAAGPWIAGALHDATGGWDAALVFLLAVTLLELVPGLPATWRRPT